MASLSSSSSAAASMDTDQQQTPAATRSQQAETWDCRATNELKKSLGEVNFRDITREAQNRANIIAQNDTERDIAYIEIMQEVIKAAGKGPFP